MKSFKIFSIIFLLIGIAILFLGYFVFNQDKYMCFIMGLILYGFYSIFYIEAKITQTNKKIESEIEKIEARIKLINFINNEQTKINDIYNECFEKIFERIRK